MKNFRFHCACLISTVLLLAAASNTQAQNIHTVAGGGPSNGIVATSASIAAYSPAVDTSGNVYFSSGEAVYKLDPTGHLTRIAGQTIAGAFQLGANGNACPTAANIGDGGPASSALLNDPVAVALDAAGNLYIADSFSCRVRVVNMQAGTITVLGVTVAPGNIATVAGSATYGSSGDTGPATSAQLYQPNGVAVDSFGNLYIADTGNSRVRKVNTSGTITTIAGNGTRGCIGDGSAATGAELDSPVGVATDAVGNIYIADDAGCNIRVVSTQASSTAVLGVTVAPNTIASVAGDGVQGYSGENIAATSAEINLPRGVELDSSGDLYIADTGNARIRKVTTSGAISTVAGNGTAGFSGDSGPAINAEIAAPFGVALDASRDLYIADQSSSVTQTDYRIRMVTSGGTISTVAGNGAASYSGDGQTAAGAQLSNPSDVAVDAAGNLYIADSFNNVVRAVNTQSTTVTLLGVTIPPGDVATVAGNESLHNCSDMTNQCFSGDGGPATSAELELPEGVALDGAGNLYIADSGNARVREVNLSGVISTVAGNGQIGDQDGPATGTALNFPVAVAVDGASNVYIADYYGNVVREVNTQSGAISSYGGISIPAGYIATVAGNGTGGYNGDGISALSAELNGPTGIAIDPNYNLYIADNTNARLREVEVVSGTIITVAGNGTAGYSGDGGAATSAELSGPYGVTSDLFGNLYIADYSGVRVVNTQTSTITPLGVTIAPGDIATVAGNGTLGFSGDGGLATSAMIDGVQATALDLSQNLYISDFENLRIRRVDAPQDPTAPNFTLTTMIPTQTVAQGGDSATYVVTITSVNGFSGTVFISSSNDPNLGVIRPFSVNLSPGGSQNFNVTITSMLSPSGTFPVYVIGTTAGELQQSVELQLIVANPALTPSVTVTPTSSSITTTQADSVTVTVNGGSGNPTPTGYVTLTSGTYTSGAVTLSGGSAMINIPAGSLATGMDTLTATYTPDSAGGLNYANAMGSNTVTVTASDFTITTLTPTMEVSQAGDGATYVVTITPLNGFSGTIAFSVCCDSALGVSLPSSITIPTNGTAQTFNFTITSAAQLGVGTFSETITGETISGLQHSLTLNLKVDNPGLTPSVTVTPTSSSITTTQADSVTVTVNGGSGNPTATGSVTLTSGTYTPGAVTLSGGSAMINIPAGSLATSLDTLTATYTPDSAGSLIYASATGSNTVNVTAAVTTLTPTVTVTPYNSPVTTADGIGVSVSVSGVNGKPTPTGSVTLVSGSYTSAATTLNSGGANIFIASGTLPVGTDTLTVTYTPDTNSSSTYNSAIGTNSITVTAIVISTPTVTVSPFPANITTNNGLKVTVRVNSTTGGLTPSGSITLSSGSYSSAAESLVGGSVIVVVPAGALALGMDTLTATYTPDSNSASSYTSASGTNTEGVTAGTPTTIAGEWVWRGGSSTIPLAGEGQPGVYGTLKTFAAGNIPGGRVSPITWTDKSGNFWLFGGQGTDASGNAGFLNDLWEFNPGTGQWAWMGGSSTVPTGSGSSAGQSGIYGSMGTAAAGNIPGGRSAGAEFIDSSGNLWLFGGYGYGAAGLFGGLSDVWEFSPASGEWTWIAGSNGVNQNPASVTTGSAAPGNTPGAHFGEISWTDMNGNFWFFGGNTCLFGTCGYGSVPPDVGLDNSLWEFSPATKEWTFWAGGTYVTGTTTTATSNYGILGTFSAQNYPGARTNGTGWTDSSGNLWMFGGWGFDGGEAGYLNDLWEFSPSLGQWVSVGGGAGPSSSTSGAAGIYGTLGSSAIANAPGARANATSWIDSNGKVWLFGGYGFDSTGAGGPLNDLWELNTTSYEWTWVSGNSTVGTGGWPGIYGTLNVPAAVNTPGSRQLEVGWPDKNGNVWMFGGSGLDKNSTKGPLNDVWEFKPGQATLQTPTVTVSPSPTSITTAQGLTVTVTVNGGSGNPTATGSVTLTSGTYTSGAVTLSGGSAMINIPAGSLATGMDTLTASYTPDSAGSLIYSNATGSNTVTVAASSLSFVSNVGTTGAAQTVTVDIATAGTLNSIQVLTQGAPGLDFTETSGGTCATTTAYTVGQTCTVNVIFKPQVPGARPGAVLLTDASNNILGIAYLPGTGIGPQITFSPGVQSTLPNYTGLNAALPYGVAVDAGLNVYVTDYIEDLVVKMPWTGSTYGTPVTLPFAGLYFPEGVAVDGAGDVFVADWGNSRVVELPWNGSSYGTQIALANYGYGDYPTPTSVAVDSHGNLFFAEIGYGAIPTALIEMPWTGSGYGSPTTITAATGLNSPLGLAVDANLNIYIADSGNNRVVEIPWNGTSFGAENVVASGIDGAGAVAVDGGGDVYIANSSASTIIEVPWNGTAFGTPFTVPFALGVSAEPNGIAVDGYGNLYAPNFASEAVDKLSVSTPPSLSFASTAVGATSSDSPKTVTVMNIGNAGLYFNAAANNPVYPADFPINSSGSNLCSEDSSLYIGSSCNVSVAFTPTTTGPLSENVVLTDNNLNVSGAMQSIAVSGNATSAALTAQAINFTQPTTPVTWSSGLTIPLVATGGASGNAVTFSIDGTSTGTGSITSSTLTVTTPGTFVIDANQAGNSTYSAAPQVQKTLVVNQAPQTINFTAPTSPVIYSGSSFTVSLVATGGASGNAVTFTVDASSTAGAGSITGSTLTVTGLGTIVIDANQAGNTNYSAATQVQQTVLVNAPGAQTINFTQPTTPVTWSSGLQITLVATGGASGNPVVFTRDASSTGTGTVGGSTLTVTTPGTFVIDANQAGNSTYSAAPQVQRTLVVNQAPQTINFTAPTSPVIYSGTSFNVSLSATGGASGNTVTLTVDASSTAGAGSITGSTLTVTGLGTIVIDANQAGNTDYLAATQVQQTVLVNAPTPQAINFTQPTTPVTWSSGLQITLVATGGASGNPVTFSIDGTSTGTGTISGSTLTVTTPGTFVIDANQAGTSTYSAAPQVQRTLVVNKASQAISFTAPTTPVIYSGTSFNISLSATGGASGNTVTFTVDSSSTAGAGSITGSTLTVTGLGTIVIDANQAGNTDYLAATQVQQTVLVNAPTPQAINFTQPTTPVTYSSGLTIPLVATGGASGNPVLFSLNTGSTTGTGSISSSTLTVTGVGTFVINANQAGNATYSAAPQVSRTVVVTQAPQVITFTQPTTPVTYSSGLQITLSATGGASGNAVTFTVDGTSTATGTVSGSTVTVTSAGNLVIDANQAGNANYTAATQVQRSVTVNVPPPDFSFTATPPSNTVTGGTAATYTVTVTPLNGFSSTVTLSLAGQPTGATVTFAPTTLTPSEGAVSSTLTVTPTTLVVQQSRPSFWPLTAPTLALLILLPFKRWRKVWKGKLLLLVAGLASLTALGALSGCGGGFGLLQSQNYTLTITGTSGSTTHTTTVQLTVKQ